MLAELQCGQKLVGGKRTLPQSPHFTIFSVCARAASQKGVLSGSSTGSGLS
jgi:hypothetical protein